LAVIVSFGFDVSGSGRLEAEVGGVYDVVLETVLLLVTTPAELVTFEVVVVVLVVFV
jgi:hypothetical protein